MRVRMYTSKADFHKPGIYGGSAPVWATACDVFCRAPSQVGRGRAAVDFVVCFGWGGYVSLFFVFNEPIFAFRAKTPLHNEVVFCL